MTIVARELSKRFGVTPAVDALTLSVARGEVYGLIGPNGAGKTTALRMLAGLMQPTSGAAEICGFDLEQRSSEAKACLGFLTGTTGLYARLTVTELLRYFGELYGLSGVTLGARVAAVTGMLHIEHLRGRKCGGLSTGERQRVSLARAMLHDPAALILDEPTSGLDVVASRFVGEFIRDARARGRAILLSTHYMTEAELLCDRIGLLHRGVLQREGPPATLKAELGVGSLEEAFLRLVEREPAA
jgi:ABC-type multidrug transport system ATPase subunit